MLFLTKTSEMSVGPARLKRSRREKMESIVSPLVEQSISRIKDHSHTRVQHFSNDKNAHADSHAASGRHRVYHVTRFVPRSVLFHFEVPAKLIVSSLAATLTGGGLFGFDTGTIAAITIMPYFEKTYGVLSPFMQGFVVSIILPASAVSGIFGGRISDYFSRKRTVSLGALIFAIGSAVSAGSSTLAGLICGRLIAGFGEGLFLTCLSVYMYVISLYICSGRGS